MNNVNVSWQASPSPNVNYYYVTWTHNGMNLKPIAVQQNPAQDLAGYSLEFQSSTDATPKPGDTISVNVTANDNVNDLSSTTVTLPPVTMPVPAPTLPPQNVTLTLS